MAVRNLIITLKQAAADELDCTDLATCFRQIERWVPNIDQAISAAISSITNRLLPPGGTLNQVLFKTSAADYAVAWGRRSEARAVGATTNATGVITVTYVIPFPAIPVPVVTGTTTGGGGQLFLYTVTAVTTTTFNVLVWNTVGSGNSVNNTAVTFNYFVQ